MDKNISRAALVRFLTPATLIFLVLPYLIFFFGWLHWWLALPMTVVCLIPIWMEWKRPQEMLQDHPEATITAWQITMMCGVALFLVLISGIGGWGWQQQDWDKHNTLLKDLIEKPWPVLYQFQARQLPLVYYFAYYLPAALIGKTFGWVIANHILLFESWLGLSLTFLWGFVLTKKSWWKAVLIIAFFSGADVIGYILMAPLAPTFLGKTINIHNFEWWSMGWLLPAFTHTLFWTPGQGIVGWLATSLILNDMFKRGNRYSLWHLGLTTLWGPFITIGLCPFVFVDWLAEPDKLKPWIVKSGVANLCGVLLGGLISFMFLSKLYALPQEISGKISYGFFFALAQDNSEVIFGLILLSFFWLMEGGLLGILIWKLLDPKDKQSRLILIVALAVLGVLPFVYYGYYNDLLHKTSIPALFALSIVAGRAAWNHTGRRGLRLAVNVLLAIGFVAALLNIGFQLEGMTKNGTIRHLPNASDVFSLWQLQEKEQNAPFEIRGLEYNSLLSQYLGSNEAPFFQWFVRQ